MEFKRGRQFTDEEFADIVTGKCVPPNFELVPPELFPAVLDSIICGAGRSIGPVAWVQVPGPERFNKHWARYVLNQGQGGGLTGEGLIMIYGGGHGGGYTIPSYDPVKHGPKLARFALCRHQKQADRDADPRRGWHPGYCTLCGLDMTVDSGD